MPLEFCFIPSDEDPYHEYDHQLVEAGSGLLIENYASGEKEVIGLECLPGDIRVTIKIFPAEGILEDMGAEDLPDDVNWRLFPPPIATIELQPEQFEDIDFFDGESAKGTFRVRRVGNGAITSSGIIPQGLYYPN